MKTQEEIVARIKYLAKDDMFGFATQDLIYALELDLAAPYLNEAFVKEIRAGEKEWKRPPTDEEIKKELIGYLDFAWEKCLGHRGISASRSIGHFTAWCWLLGDEGSVAFLENDTNFAQYGAPCLAYLSKKYGHEMPTGVDAQRMSRGEKCEPTCEGCGH